MKRLFIFTYLLIGCVYSSSINDDEKNIYIKSYEYIYSSNEVKDYFSKYIEYELKPSIAVWDTVKILNRVFFIEDIISYEFPTRPDREFLRDSLLTVENSRKSTLFFRSSLRQLVTDSDSSLCLYFGIIEDNWLRADLYANTQGTKIDETKSIKWFNPSISFLFYFNEKTETDTVFMRYFD